jgi:hypothetical protein
MLENDIRPGDTLKKAPKPSGKQTAGKDDAD